MTIEHDVLGLSLSRLNHIDDQRVLAFALENLAAHVLNIEALSIVVD